MVWQEGLRDRFSFGVHINESIVMVFLFSFSPSPFEENVYQG